MWVSTFVNTMGRGGGGGYQGRGVESEGRVRAETKLPRSLDGH